MNAPPTRACTAVAIPPGPGGLALLLPALRAALAGSGPALALMPANGPAGYVERLRAALRPGDPVPESVAVVLATSGSTGDPAGVLVPGSALTAAASGFAALSARPRGHRWVAGLPLHHAGGLMVAVRSLHAGTTPVAMSSLGGAAPFTLACFAEATERATAASRADGLPLATSLVPAMLSVLAAAGPEALDLLGRYDVVLVGGAATPRALMQRMRAAGVRARATYGMTETCGGAVIDDLPLPGVRVRVGPGGRLEISGEQVALGYRDGRMPERWTTTGGLRCFRTDDIGAVGSHGTVTVHGRADDVVQVGGASVSLGAVRDVIAAEPGVAEVAVVAVPHERYGATVVAFVVPGPAVADGAGTPADPAADAFGTALADAVEARLGRSARPRAVHLRPALPMLASGKPDLTTLRQQAVVGWAARMGETSVADR